MIVKASITIITIDGVKSSVSGVVLADASSEGWA